VLDRIQSSVPNSRVIFFAAFEIKSFFDLDEAVLRCVGVRIRVGFSYDFRTERGDNARLAEGIGIRLIGEGSLELEFEFGSRCFRLSQPEVNN